MHTAYRYGYILVCAYGEPVWADGHLRRDIIRRRGFRDAPNRKDRGKSLLDVTHAGPQARGYSYGEAALTTMDQLPLPPRYACSSVSACADEAGPSPWPALPPRRCACACLRVCVARSFGRYIYTCAHIYIMCVSFAELSEPQTCHFFFRGGTLAAGVVGREDERTMARKRGGEGMPSANRLDDHPVRRFTRLSRSKLRLRGCQEARRNPGGGGGGDRPSWRRDGTWMRRRV